jgi:hypothetical protein
VRPRRQAGVVARPLSFTVRGTVGGKREAGASTSFDLEDPSLPRRVGKAIRFLDLTQCQSRRDAPWWRAAAEAVASASAAPVGALRSASELRAGAR